MVQVHAPQGVGVRVPSWAPAVLCYNTYSAATLSFRSNSVVCQHPLCQRGCVANSIKKRGDSYRVQVRRKGFPPESATFRARAQAVEWGKAREAELVGTRHGIIPRRTVRQALEKWRDDVSPTHGGPRWETVRIEKLLRELPFVDRQIRASWHRTTSPNDATMSARRWPNLRWRASTGSYVGYPSWRPPDGSGYVIPRSRG
jgi:hypothetical protein